MRPTRPQTARHHDDRIRNVRGAFAVRRPPRVAGLRVLLVDDVMTTGATLDEIAGALKEGGAARVVNWVAARTFPPQLQ